MTLLEDLGIPVEAERGRYGGYRLRPGYKLPPLMFTEDEALALVLGLLVVRQSGLAGTPADVGGRVGQGRAGDAGPPARARPRRAGGGRAHRRARDTRPKGAIIGALSEAAHRRRRVQLRYRCGTGRGDCARGGHLRRGLPGRSLVRGRLRPPARGSAHLPGGSRARRPACATRPSPRPRTSTRGACGARSGDHARRPDGRRCCWRRRWRRHDG